RLQLITAVQRCDNRSVPYCEIGPESALTLGSKADPILSSVPRMYGGALFLGISAIVESIE
ncbi:MAG: hypothetical protein E6848_20130, partial [Bradyrhizobium sp.]|nr:hypothetical protein [Bradyrhizobium sp.]